MKSFVIGLAIGLLGVILWLLSSLIAGVGEGLGAEPLPLLHTLVKIGFVVMLGGPVVFWIILPIKRRLLKGGNQV